MVFRKQEVLYYDKEKTLEEDGGDGRSALYFCPWRSRHGSRGSGESAAAANEMKTVVEQKGAEKLHLTNEWDKTFPESKEVNHRKVTFHNRYGIELAADLYEPKNAKKGSLAAIAVSGPFGAVKEQASGLYAQELAKRGFLTIAFDPSYTGESGSVNGVRNVASPDINTEDFSAAVDFFRLKRMSIRSVSASSASAASEVLPSMQQLWIRASRRPSPRRCMTSVEELLTATSTMRKMRGRSPKSVW